MRVLRKRLRVGFYTFALYDLDRRHYGTYTDYDFPRPPRIRLRHKIDAGPDHLALRFDSAAGTARWEQRRDAERDAGSVRVGRLAARCRSPRRSHAARAGHRGRPAAGAARRPPARRRDDVPRRAAHLLLLPERPRHARPAGLGRSRGGRRPARSAGSIASGRPTTSPCTRTRAEPRYRNEWRVIQLDDGWDMSCFHQYQRDAAQRRRAVDRALGTGAGARFELRATPDVDLTTFRSSSAARASSGAARCSPRGRAGSRTATAARAEWDLDLRRDPLVDAPAHALPIEYWTGPVRIEGTCSRARRHGMGLRRALPAVESRGLRAGTGAPAHPRARRDARRGAPGPARLPLPSEVEALALRGDPAAATAHARRHIQPWMSLLDAKTQSLADDLLVALSGRFRTR